MKRLLLLIATLFILISCSGEIPQGEDDNGFYKLHNKCVSCHKELRIVLFHTGKTLMPIRRYVNVCDSSITTKIYIPVEKVDKEWLDRYLRIKK